MGSLSSYGMRSFGYIVFELNLSEDDIKLRINNSESIIFKFKRLINERLARIVSTALRRIIRNSSKAPTR